MSVTASRRALAVLVAVGLAVLAVVVAALPAGADNTEYVLYYTVTSSYQGAPENLNEIAERFLGDSSRSSEVFNLNVGRKQPDGASLQDPAVLHPGWQLVLPWDAVGAAVQNGLLPTTSPATPGAAKPPATKPPATKPTGTAASNPPRTSDPGSQAGGLRPSPPGKPSRGAASGSCAAKTDSADRSDWAAKRLAPDKAWQLTKGKGELVAVIDSGVDGSLPQLSGHVVVGADIVTGSGRGDTDCIGSGTAMASLIAAQPGQSGGVTGVSPDAAVMPIRVVGADSTKAQPADGATAIEVAVSSGATVVTLGAFVDTSDPQVAEAIAAATKHDVVVVAPAPVASAPAGPAGDNNSGGVLWVGGVGVDGQPIEAYRPGAVAVVAPGANVTSLGVTGTGTASRTGTQYAAALAAGTVALVRSAYPKLTAAQVVHRVEATADPLGGSVPDSRYGWGMVNPSNAVSTVLTDEAQSVTTGAAAPAHPGSSGHRILLVAVCVLIGLVAVALLILRGRRLLRGVPALDGEPDASGALPRPAGDGTGGQP